MALVRTSPLVIMILFFDTETTGVRKYEAHLVQIAWVLTDVTGTVISRHCHVIRPKGYSIPPSATRIHGITTAAAALNGRDLADVLRDFSRDAARAMLLVAHNMQFDFGILESNFLKAGVSFPLRGKSQICTMRASTGWCQLPKLDGSRGFKYPTLAELHFRLFCKGFDGEHDAMGDTLACMRSYFALKQLGVIPSRVERQTSEVDRIHQSRIAEQERELIKAEDDIRRRYESSLSAMSDPGHFIAWWIGCSVVVAMGVSAMAKRVTDGGLFIFSMVIGLLAAFFARELVRESKQKGAAYVAEVAARERAVAAVRSSPSPTDSLGGATLTPKTHAPPMTHQGHSATTAAFPNMASSVKNREQQKVVPDSTQRYAGVKLSGSPDAETARNQFRDPMNVARLKLISAGVPEEPGVAVVTGLSRIRSVVVYGENVRRAVRGFLLWAEKTNDVDWCDFLSHGFSPAEFGAVNSSCENAGSEAKMALAESDRIQRSGARSKVFNPRLADVYLHRMTEFR
jgi:DNA polymerase-3 subunit epsilon